MEQPDDTNRQGEGSDGERADIAKCVLLLIKANRVNEMRRCLVDLLQAWEHANNDPEDHGGHLTLWLYHNGYASPDTAVFSDFNESNSAPWAALIRAAQHILDFFYHGGGNVAEPMPQQAANYIQRTLITPLQAASTEQRFIEKWQHLQELSCLRLLDSITQMEPTALENLAQLSSNNSVLVQPEGVKKPGRPGKRFPIDVFLDTDPTTKIQGAKGKRPTIKQWALIIRNSAIDHFKRIDPSFQRSDTHSHRSIVDILNTYWMRVSEQYDDREAAWITRWEKKTKPVKH